MPRVAAILVIALLIASFLLIPQIEQISAESGQSPSSATSVEPDKGPSDKGFVHLSRTIRVGSLPAADNDTAATTVHHPAIDRDRNVMQKKQSSAKQFLPPLVPSPVPPLFSSGPALLAPSIASTVSNSGSIAQATSFAGLNRNSAGAWYPPDVQVAAGPSHVMQVVNTVYAVYNKQGVLLKQFTMPDFFDAYGNCNYGDPRLVFDTQSSRWFTVIFQDFSSPCPGVGPYQISLAISQTSDPTGDWYLYDIPYGSVLPDQPKVATTADKVVISANTFGPGQGFRVFNKSDLLAGLAAPQYDAFNLGPNLDPVYIIQGDSSNTLLYAVLLDTGTPFGSGGDNYFPLSTTVYTVSGTVPNTRLSQFTLPVSSALVPPTYYQTGQTVQDAVQPGSTLPIDTGYMWVNSAAWHDGLMWFAFAHSCKFTGDSTVYSCMRYQEIDTTSHQVLRDESFGSKGVYYFYPTIMMDGSSNVYALFGSSSASNFASLYYFGSRPGDPPGFGPFTYTLATGNSPATEGYDPGFGGVRYGDFFGAAVDPSDKNKVWVSGEFEGLNAQSQSIWKTQVAGLSRPVVSTTTDKSQYNLGQTVKISGKADGIIPGYQVSLVVNNPSGSLYTSTSVPLNSDGTYDYQFVLGAAAQIGTYTVTASYFDVSTAVTFSAIQQTAFPISHMADTTQTYGSLTNSARSLNTEIVTASSQLVGDQIDRITLLLQKVGAPSGTAEVGVFNSDTSTKKVFGIINVANLAASYTQYQFSLANNELYTIQAGDRIGIKFTGGSSLSGINVMTDKNIADPFDGPNTYRARYQPGGWIYDVAEDLWMVLEQTHSPVTFTPVVHMSDTTASFASLISAPRQLIAEYAGSTSQLVGDKIDSITMRLQKVGAPTGIAQVGIFNSDLSAKKVFTTVDVSTISATATDYEFKLAAADPLYTIVSGDRIGIKYTGGSSTVGINVTPDRDAADPFDGTNSYRVRYEAGWVVTTSEDMYMTLRQTHP